MADDRVNLNLSGADLDLILGALDFLAEEAGRPDAANPRTAIGARIAAEASAVRARLGAARAGK